MGLGVIARVEAGLRVASPRSHAPGSAMSEVRSRHRPPFCARTSSPHVESSMTLKRPLAGSLRTDDGMPKPTPLTPVDRFVLSYGVAATRCAGGGRAGAKVAPPSALAKSVVDV